MKISTAPSDVLISFNLITEHTTPRDLNRTEWVELSAHAKDVILKIMMIVDDIFLIIKV